MFLCPHCRRELPPILPEFAGQTISCPHCGGGFEAPEPVAPPVAVRQHPVDEAASRVASVWRGGPGEKIKIAMLVTTILWIGAMLVCAFLNASSAARESSPFDESRGITMLLALIFGAMCPTCPYVVAMIVLGVAYFVFKK